MEKLTETTGLDHALKLHKLGLRLTPLRGKSPFLRGWPNLHLTKDELLKFGEQGCNFGIILHDPAVPFCVLDTDSAEAEGWVNARGINSTVIVRSGGEGDRRHRYFRIPESVTELRSKQNLFGVKGLELKALGCSIVAAGSTHPNTGKRYEYLPGKELKELHLVSQWDMKWLKSDKSVVCSVPVRTLVPSNTKVKNALAYIMRIPSVQGQNGSGAAYRVAAILYEAGMTFQEILDAMKFWNECNAIPLWSEPQLRHKIQSVFKNKQGKNQTNVTE